MSNMKTLNRNHETHKPYKTPINIYRDVTPRRVRNPNNHIGFQAESSFKRKPNQSNQDLSNKKKKRSNNSGNLRTHNQFRESNSTLSFKFLKQIHDLKITKHLLI